MKIATAATLAGTPTTSVRKMAKYAATMVVVRLNPKSPDPYIHFCQAGSLFFIEGFPSRGGMHYFTPTCCI
jgi:hypothetical protein